MRRFISLLWLISAFILWGCGGGDTEPATNNQGASSASELSDWELKNGIGPIKSPVSLGEIDETLANQGKEIFDAKCTACHKLDERYIGPALRDVTSRRSAEFVMNMMLNPDEMVKRHPEGQKLLATYLAPMTFQNLTQEDARAILEYFRVEAEKPAVVEEKPTTTN